MAVPLAAAAKAAATKAAKKYGWNKARKAFTSRRDEDKKGSWMKWIAGLLVLPMLPVFGVMVLVMFAFGALSLLAGSASACGTTGTAAGPSTATSASQTANVRTIIGVAKGKNIPMEGWVVALDTALDESGIQNQGNSGIPESLHPGPPADPVEGVSNPASSGTSVGVFQQLANTGWGTVPEEMNVAHAAGAFFDALLAIPNWQSLPPDVAATDVQHNQAGAIVYSKFVTQAQSLASANTDAPPIQTGGKTFSAGSGGSSSGAAASSCGVSVGGYVDPFKTGSWGLSRTDQGTDWLPNVDDPIIAIGNGHITYASNNDCGWPGAIVNHVQVSCAGCVVYELDDGSLKGSYIYVCEHITVTKMSGTITAGEQIGVAHPGSAWTEWGWAKAPGTSSEPDTPYTAAQAAGDANGLDEATQGGEAFARFINSLGTKPRDLYKAPTGPFGPP